MSDEEFPLVCNLTAIAPTQRAAYEAQKRRLRQAIVEIEELPDGYAFRFNSEPNLLVAVAEFVEGERQCCGFFTFRIDVLPNNGGVHLQITGPNDTREFIKEALAL